MKYFKFFLVGTLFGITMYKSEAVSWFRIQEMFHFQSFHMYGIIGSSVVIGMVIVQIIKRLHMKDVDGNEVVFHDKKKSIPRYTIGGFIFGLGWALAGICPGPMFVLMGAGFSSLIVFFAAAIIGTFLYGVLRDKLPH